MFKVNALKLTKGYLRIRSTKKLSKISLPATKGDEAAILLQERVKTGHEFDLPIQNEAIGAQFLV